MTDRCLNVIRLVLFCVLAFVPFWIILPMMNAAYGEPVYMCEAAQPAVYALGVFGMLIPSAAHLITRLVTKEGFRNTYLGLHFKGNGKWFPVSVGVKLVESAVGALLIWRLFADGMSFREAFPMEQPKALLGLLLLQIAFSIIVFFPAFGEEWGWRGYMMPKLMKFMGKPAAIVVGGVIWGAWHAPLTIAGHNFGTDYPLYPWGGIFVMCLMCVLMNAFLTLLTEKTKSIYPASFCHMISNNLSATVLIMIVGSEKLWDIVETTSGMNLFLMTYLPPLLITGILSFLYLTKSES